MAMEFPTRPWSDRWRSWLALGLVGSTLTVIGLVVGLWGSFRGKSLHEIPALSVNDTRLIDEIRKLGGDAHVLDWEPGLLGLSRGRGLLYVSFQGKSVSDLALARFVQRDGSRLRGLTLSNTGISDDGLRHLAGLTVIRELDIGNLDPPHALRGATFPVNTITSAGVGHLKGLTSLRSLNLGGLPVDDADLDALKDLPNLVSLYLDRTKVRGPWFGRLKSLPKLAGVYLDGSAINDEGLSYLKGASGLQFLSVAGVRLTANGLAHLKMLPKLNRLDVKGCGLGFEALDEFQVACPRVKIE